MGRPEGVALPLIIKEVHAQAIVIEQQAIINVIIFFIQILLKFAKVHHLALEQ